MLGRAISCKSKLCIAVFHHVIRIFQQHGNNPDYPVTLLTCLIGIASYYMEGSTPHDVRHLTSGIYYSLSSSHSLLAIQLPGLVYYSISLVGRIIFIHIQRRLRETKETETPNVCLQESVSL